MYAVKFDAKVSKVISKWKKSNPLLFRKFVKVINAIADDPRHGIGHPEPLIGGRDMIYSRHISAHDRIIYRIYDNEVYVLVIELEGHHDDK